MDKEVVIDGNGNIDKAKRMIALFDNAENALSDLLKFIEELGYEPPGTRFSEILQRGHRITGSNRTFDAILDNQSTSIQVSELDRYEVIGRNDASFLPVIRLINYNSSDSRGKLCRADMDGGIGDGRTQA
ncbi:hypothetical protein [Sideroxyarcus sp. TK5]